MHTFTVRCISGDTLDVLQRVVVEHLLGLLHKLAVLPLSDDAGAAGVEVDRLLASLLVALLEPSEDSLDDVEAARRGATIRR